MTAFDNILNAVAEEYNTTPAEVEKEIKAAINAAGLDLSPEVFIALCSAKVKSEMDKEILY